jgi:hypothetical protein
MMLIVEQGIAANDVPDEVILRVLSDPSKRRPSTLSELR